MARKKKGKNPAGYGGHEYLDSGLVRWKARVDGHRRSGPAVEPDEGKLPTESARLAFWAMIDEERRAAAIEALKTTTLSWHLYELYRKGGEILTDGTVAAPGLLETEEYSPDSLSLGRTVFNRYVRNDPIGDMNVSSIRTIHLRAWLKRVPGKPRTRIRYFSVMSAALQRLVDADELESNPAHGVKMPKTEEPTIRVLKDLAQQGLLAAVREPPDAERLAKIVAERAKRKSEKDTQTGRVLTPAVRERTYEATVFLLHGARRAEVCGLRHESYDPVHKGATVGRQKKADGSVRETTKGRKDRWIPLDDEACAIMARKEAGWVFPVTTRKKGKDPVVNALNPRQLERDLDAQLRFTVYDGVDPHDLRHSAVYSMKKSGDTKAAADIMGHSVEVMLGVYDRSDEEDRRRAFSKARGVDCPTDCPTDPKPDAV